MPQKIVICGAGFLGSHIARAISAANHGSISMKLQIASRSPNKVYNSLKSSIPPTQLLPPVNLDVTKPDSLQSAFDGATAVVSLVGIMHGTPEDFERIQFKGAENVAHASNQVGAKLVHISAIGADSKSKTPYARTKALAETSVLKICPDATIIRPSLVFGPEDDFFNRFSKLSKIMPFLPVFGGGLSKFQPVYVGDIARAVETITREDPQIRSITSGKIIEAGGPEVFIYRDLMKLVLRYNGRKRPIISLPFELGLLQGAIMEKLPVNLFTVTRAQVEQLKFDNVANTAPDQTSFKDFVEYHGGTPLKSVHDILPMYL